MKHRNEKTTFVPRVDVLETSEEFLLSADLPGTGPGEVEVRYDKGVLTLHGTVEDRGNGEMHTLLCEYGVGDFERSLEVGDAIDAKRIQAEISDGVLTVHLPKKESAKPRRIDVNSNEERRKR